MFIVVLFTGCQETHQIRSSTLLDNVVSEDGEEYKFEQIEWFTNKEKLIDNGHIPSDNITELDDERIKLVETVEFNDPQTDAIVIYSFFNDEFVGGEYIIIVENEEELITISKELKTTLSEEFPPPLANTLDELSEETIRDGKSSGVRWWAEDNSGFNISVSASSSTDSTEYILNIQVFGPREVPNSLKDFID